MADPVETTFTKPRCRPAFIDLFLHRRSILRELSAILPQLSGTLLDVGCGQKPYRNLLLAPPSQVQNYIGLDIPGGKYRYAEVCWDGGRVPLGDGSIDCALATEVLEHVSEPATVLGECWRVLRPGGVLFFTVPFLWPLHDIPFDEYRYTPFALQRLLASVGFKDILLKPLGGWDASLAQMLGLWARRRPMPRPLRWGASLFATPFVWVLATVDQRPERFSEGAMITGIAGTCRKLPAKGLGAEDIGETAEGR